MRILTSVLAVAALLLSGPLFAGGHSGQKVSKIEDIPARTGDWTAEETARGREQLVRAFDAAWIRVIASGKDREIVMTEPTNRPGAAVGYIRKLVDCLPTPEVALWP
ncbi:MAG: hypothetical protein QF580_07535, partial [Gammaproteobacteria bacterium]|nr:hypothetical protein [Gammaproteobacteria bacterium]